jgi:tetratricopeptide (TPR) repeat protein
VFDAFVDSLQRLPALLVMTHRPGIEKRWEEFGHVTHHSLNRLGRNEMDVLIDRVTGGKALPENLLDQVLERTDGVPLFVEELIKTIVESDLVREVDGRYVTDNILPSMAIPSTLRDSLMERLDRLSRVKGVAQAAACIGREFSSSLLASIIDSDDITAKLDQLIKAGLIFRRGSGDISRYAFKHALVQDAAYESLLKSRRRVLHARIAAQLEAENYGQTRIEPELLAHHYTEAGLIDEALKYWLQAGQQSSRRCAHTEAIAHLQRGLAIIDELPEGEQKDRHEIEFRVAIGVPLVSNEGAASDNVAENYVHAQKLCEQLEETEHLYPVLWGSWLHHFYKSELQQACDMADRLLEIGQSRQDTELQLEAHHCQWGVRFVGGDLRVALEHCEQGLKLYRPDLHHRLTFIYGGHDPGVCAYNISGITLWLLGYPEQAQKRFDSAVNLSRELEHTTTLCEALHIVVLVSVLQRDIKTLEPQINELLDLAESEQMPDYTILSQGIKGWVSFRQGNKERGLEEMREAVKHWLKKGIKWTAIPISLVAEAFGEIGELQQGLDLIDEALIPRQFDEDLWWKSELYRMKGQLLSQYGKGDLAAAEKAYKRSIVIAQIQDAKLLELRAVNGMADLWLNQGKIKPVQELLTPVYGWFTEGFETVDLKLSKSILDGL